MEDEYKPKKDMSQSIEGDAENKTVIVKANLEEKQKQFKNELLINKKKLFLRKNCPYFEDCEWVDKAFLNKCKRECSTYLTICENNIIKLKSAYAKAKAKEAELGSSVEMGRIDKRYLELEKELLQTRKMLRKNSLKKI